MEAFRSWVRQVELFCNSASKGFEKWSDHATQLRKASKSGVIMQPGSERLRKHPVVRQGEEEEEEEDHDDDVHKTKFRCVYRFPFNFFFFRSSVDIS